VHAVHLWQGLEQIHVHAQVRYPLVLGLLSIAVASTRRQVITHLVETNWWKYRCGQESRQMSSQTDWDGNSDQTTTPLPRSGRIAHL